MRIASAGNVHRIDWHTFFPNPLTTEGPFPKQVLSRKEAAPQLDWSTVDLGFGRSGASKLNALFAMLAGNAEDGQHLSCEMSDQPETKYSCTQIR